MNKIILIGKNGQLGNALTVDALSFGYEIFSFDKEELDATNESQVREKIEKIKPDILINTSAYHVLSDCEKNPLNAMSVNFEAIHKLTRLCKKNNIKFVTYSTDYVFDGKKGSSYVETDTPNPLQVYGISKLAGEYTALNLFPEGAFVIRTCGIYGGKEGSNDKKGNFVLNILKEVEEKDEIEVSSEQIVSPTFANDLSKATLQLLAKEANPGVYHLVNEGLCSWYEFTKEIFKLVKIDKKVIPVDRHGLSGEMMRPKFSALENTKAKALGIVLPLWQEGVKSYLDFLNK